MTKAARAYYTHNCIGMNQKTIGIAVIALLIGYGAGYLTHSSAALVQNARGTFAGAGAGGVMLRGGSVGNGGFLSGTVAAKDAGSITVNTRDGSSHIVLLTPATTVAKSVSGSTSDVSVGAEVVISGATNGDGSVSASTIQLRPATPVQPAQ